MFQILIRTFKKPSLSSWLKKENIFSLNYQFLIIGRGAWGKEYDLIGNLWGPLPRRLESCESDPYISFPKFGGGGRVGLWRLWEPSFHYITLHYMVIIFFSCFLSGSERRCEKTNRSWKPTSNSLFQPAVWTRRDLQSDATPLKIHSVSLASFSGHEVP